MDPNEETLDVSECQDMIIHKNVVNQDTSDQVSELCTACNILCIVITLTTICVILPIFIDSHIHFKYILIVIFFSGLTIMFCLISMVWTFLYLKRNYDNATF